MSAPAPPARPATKSFLRKVTLDFVTHNDNKDFDTQFDVEIVNRLDATHATGIAVGNNLFPGEEFVDGGPVHSVSWPSDDGNLTLNEIDLADMVRPEVSITIHPNGRDRWIFDYRVTFEFADPDDFEEKRAVYISHTGGVILDQDNNKHSGVYQGPSFPRVAARTAPPLVPPAAGTTLQGTTPPDTTTVPLPAVARQQWLPIPAGSTLGPDMFLVENRSAPGLVLQPTDPIQAGPVVLRPVAQPPVSLKAWKITSPALAG